jgi:polyisoprenoid-binding protein YceI
MGHRLTIAMTSWHAVVHWVDEHPDSVTLTVDVDSLHVVGGEGGVTSLSRADKALVRSNALKTLEQKRFPTITYRADAVEKHGDGYRLTGTLEIHGNCRDHTVEVRVDDLGDRWRVTGESDVRQSEFGIKPYSMMLGAMKVVDEVGVTLTAEYRRDN